MDAQTIKILGGVLAASLVHALIPSHWLSFVLVGRANGWKLGRTLVITAVAGCLHILSTVALGIAITLVGTQFIHEEDFTKISALLLLAIGFLYVLLHLTKREGEHDHEHCQEMPAKPTVAALFLMLTLSPCEEVIPFFFAAASGGVGLWILATAVLLTTTIGAMLILTTIAYRGVEKIKFHFIEHNERFIIGVILCLIGVALLIV